MRWKSLFYCILMAFVLILGNQLCSDVFATYANGECWFDMFGSVSNGTVNAESYSIVSPTDDYQTDSGSDVFAQTNVNTASGAASSFADSPYYLASQAVVSAEAQAYALDETKAWADLEGTGMIASATGTASPWFLPSYELDLPSGSAGYVQFYIGVYEGSQPGINLLLTPQGDWSQINLGSEANPFYVLSATYNSGSNNGAENWNIPIVQDTEYCFYSFVEANADVVPEPATLLLLGFGAAVLRRKR